ncbi:MAG: MlaD family protein [Candidatus Omnitrophica bacterium]|nr:MlaD family protein [Candidatus Omnitrophota bacterium]
MSDSTKLELKLGIFVFIAIIILVVSIFSVGDFQSWHSGGYKIFIKFGFLNGVKLGAPVRFRGVDVGEVRDIDIVTDVESINSFVKVTCWIKKSVKVPKDSGVWVNTLGILGEKYIEIMPGEAKDVLEPESFIIGNDPIAMHEIAELTKKIITRIDTELIRLKTQEGTLGKLLYDDQLYRKIYTIIENLETLVLDLKAHPWKLFFIPKKKN